MALFTTAYFPSISYMARFLQDPEPWIEVYETYHMINSYHRAFSIAFDDLVKFRKDKEMAAGIKHGENEEEEK